MIGANEIVGGLHPRRKRFETWELRRPPVEMTDAIRALIDASSSQGRLFPQALSEAFGQLDDVDRIVLELVPHSDHFGPDPVTGQPLTGVLCRITVVRRGRSTTLLIDTTDFTTTHPSGHPAFFAADAASELVRLDQMQSGY